MLAKSDPAVSFTTALHDPQIFCSPDMLVAPEGCRWQTSRPLVPRSTSACGLGGRAHQLYRRPWSASPAAKYRRP